MTAADLTLDFSKHRVDDGAVSALIDVARRAGVEERRDAMFAGRHINTTEDRAVLHVALRMPRSQHLEVDGRDVVADVHQVLDRMGAVATSIRSGEWTGHTGKRITTVVNIGIGGSDLGPAMAYEALLDYAAPDIDAGSCPTSTRSTCTTRPTTSIRPRPCSWSARRRSPRWRP